jgi:hypothetical protein
MYGRGDHRAELGHATEVPATSLPGIAHDHLEAVAFPDVRGIVARRDAVVRSFGRRAVAPPARCGGRTAFTMRPQRLDSC